MSSRPTGYRPIEAATTVTRGGAAQVVHFDFGGTVQYYVGANNCSQPASQKQGRRRTVNTEPNSIPINKIDDLLPWKLARCFETQLAA